MASYARRFVQHNVRLVGGCCGTTPEHIRQIKAAVRAAAAGRRPPSLPPDRFSALREEGASIVAGRGRRTAVRMEAAASRTNRICVVQDTSSSALRVSASTVHPPR